MSSFQAKLLIAKRHPSYWDDDIVYSPVKNIGKPRVLRYAKTLYKPTRPPEIDALIKKYTRSKLPNFFIEAKGKSREQVEPVNNSFVNKLRSVIKKKRLSFKEFSVLNYRMLMTNPNIDYIDDVVLEIYKNKTYEFHNKFTNIREDEDEETVIPYTIQIIKHELSSTGYSDIEIADMLVKYLYGTDSDAKMILWECYGDILVANIERHLNPRETYCKQCGKRFIPKSNANKYCDSCFEKKQKKNGTRTITCIDCGKTFTVPSTVRSKKRCDDCQAIEKRRQEREKKRRQRQKM